MGNTSLISPTVDGVVVALCADYGRRKRAIEERGICRRTDTELRYLNARIYDAVAEVVGEPLAEQFIKVCWLTRLKAPCPRPVSCCREHWSSITA